MQGLAQATIYDEHDYSGASFPPPRANQVRAIEALRAGFRAGHRRQMLMAPTGAGKTYLGLQLIHEALKRGSKCLFICDRITLINQTSEVATRYGLVNHGIIQAKHWRRNNAPFQIGSVQTIARAGWPISGVIVIDEAHTLYSTWKKHIMETSAAVIGLSATPFSKGLAELFSNLVNAATMHELVSEGVLVPLRIKSATKIDMAGAPTKASGEWADSAAEQRGMEIVGDVVKEWILHGEDRKTIAFGATVAHCEELVRHFVGAGIPSATFTGETPEDERAELLRDYRSGRLKVLVSVEALAKGFDVPDVGCVVDARPLRKSLSTAIQMWGRGLRCAPGKQDCILLDHSGNIIRFARDFEDIYYNGLSEMKEAEKLDKKVRVEEQGKPDPKCPQCGYVPFVSRCMKCGYVHQRSSSVVAVPGEMREVNLLSVGGKSIGGREDVWTQAVNYARMYGRPETAPQRAAHLYRSITGVWPRGMKDFDAVPIAAVSRAVVNKERDRLRQWKASVR